MKTLETSRLILRDWRERDFHDLFEYARDYRVGPNAGWPVHKTGQESKTAIRTYISSNLL